MKRELEIKIAPRPQFRAYLTRAERFACIVAHRRAGKTYGCIQDLLARALTHKRSGPILRYGYIAPTRDQAKDIVWGYLTAFTQDIPGIVLNKAELLLTLPEVFTLRLYSGDSSDRMRGLYFDGVVVDEPADIDDDAWPFVIRPCLSDYAGWATFIGTPKGQDAFYSIWKQASVDPAWFSLVLRASESGIIPEAELLSLRAGMPDYAFRQEYECDFTVPIPGAIYAAELDKAREEGRIGFWPVDPSCLVHCAFDLGSPMNTVCWYFQMAGPMLRVVDVDYELELTSAARWGHMLAKPFGHMLGKVFLPHDAASKNATGESPVQSFARAGMRQISIIPRTHDSWTGINALKELFPLIQFDAGKCGDALAVLGRYHTRTNTTATLIDEPVHDRSSHYADALRYVAEAIRCGMVRFPWGPGLDPSNVRMPERHGSVYEPVKRRAKPMRVGG